jgi:hypothetical protein
MHRLCKLEGLSPVVRVTRIESHVRSESSSAILIVDDTKQIKRKRKV